MFLDLVSIRIVRQTGMTVLYQKVSDRIGGVLCNELPQKQA